MVRTKAKAGLQPSFYVQETDLNCLQRNWPAYTTAQKVQTHGEMHCENHFKAFRTLVFTSTQDSEPPDKTTKDKKKKYHKNRRDSRDSATPANGVNTAEVGDKKRKRKKDKSEVTYFNYKKKKYYANKCQECRKSNNLCQSWWLLLQWLVLEKKPWNAFHAFTTRSSSRKTWTRLRFRLWSIQKVRSMLFIQHLPSN